MADFTKFCQIKKKKISQVGKKESVGPVKQGFFFFVAVNAIFLAQGYLWNQKLYFAELDMKLWFIS